MEEIREILSWLLIVSGASFCVIGSLGLLRLSEFYARMHGASIVDTLGATLLLLGLMLQPSDWTVVTKLAVILFFLIVTTPTAAHALIHAAYTSGHEPELAEADPAGGSRDDG